MDKLKGGSMTKEHERILACDKHRQKREAELDALKRSFTEILSGAFIGTAIGLMLFGCCFI